MRRREQPQRLPREGARHLRGRDRLAGVPRARSCASRTRYGRGPSASRGRGSELYDEGVGAESTGRSTGRGLRWRLGR